jgi:hypothetical protein
MVNEMLPAFAPTDAIGEKCRIVKSTLLVGPKANRFREKSLNLLLAMVASFYFSGAGKMISTWSSVLIPSDSIK